MQYKTLYYSSIGTIILTSNGIYLTGLWFTTSRFPESRVINEKDINNDLDIFKITKNWLDKYFNSEKPNLNEVPIKLIGTDFSKEVWDVLRTIPYGETITYKDIADKIAKKRNMSKMSSQAVGQAVGHNPVSIIIPCHRVIGAHGNLTGYGGGVDVKIKLLKHENVNINNMYEPKSGNAL